MKSKKTQKYQPSISLTKAQQVYINPNLLKLLSKKIDFKKLLNLFVCSLCKGYYRFAVTIRRCGHTFCRECLYKHFKQTKKLKCPEQNCLVIWKQNDLSGFVMNDIFRQKFVDSILKKHVQNQKQKLNSINNSFKINLFPLFYRFNYPCHINKNNSQDQIQMLKEDLNVLKVILKSKAYSNQLKQIKNNQSLNPIALTPIIELLPRNQKDYDLVGIKGKIKCGHTYIRNLKLFVEKQMLLNGLKKQELPQGLKYQIGISFNNRMMEDQQNFLNYQDKYENKQSIIVLVYSVDPPNY